MQLSEALGDEAFLEECYWGRTPGFKSLLPLYTPPVSVDVRDEWLAALGDCRLPLCHHVITSLELEAFLSVPL